MQLVNLTPHIVTIYHDGGQLVIPPTSPTARAEEVTTSNGAIFAHGETIPVVRSEYGAPIDLPDMEADTAYIVSAKTAQAVREHLPYRGDVFITGAAIRDGEGRVIGCQGLAVIR